MERTKEQIHNCFEANPKFKEKLKNKLKKESITKKMSLNFTNSKEDLTIKLFIDNISDSSEDLEY